MQQSKFQKHVEPILQSESSNEFPIIDTYPEEEGELLDINCVLFVDHQQRESTRMKKM